MNSSLNAKKGYFLIIAVIFILVIGLMGTIIVNMFVSRAHISVAQQQGLATFYLAESGLEIGARLLTMPNLQGSPSRVACANLTGNSLVTNSSLQSGTFTISTINNSPISSVNNLSSSITSTSTTITANNTGGFAPSGKILIDNEAIDYAGISGNSFIGVTRGVSGTNAANHASNAGIGQYLCSIDVTSAIPNLVSPQYKRELQWNVQLEEGWAVGINLSGSAWNLAHWNVPTELQLIQQSPSIASPQQLNAVSVLSNADVWTVGNKAAALRYNGTGWTNINAGIAGGDNLTSVSAVSSQEVWACADQGKLYKWTPGTNWTNPYTPGNNPNSISMLDTTGSGTANTGWVVGAKKSASRYNGTSWVSANTGITVDLNGVSTLSSTNAWAAGNGGSIFKWNGTSWGSVSTPTSQTLNSISMIASDLGDIGWAVGASSTALYYDGVSWTLRSTGLASNLALTHVVTISSKEAFLVASTGQVYEWNGNNWTLLFVSSKGLYGIDILHLKSPTSAWRQIFN